MLLVGGCTAGEGRTPAPSPSVSNTLGPPSAGRTALAQAALDGWADAVRTDDETAFTELVSSQDPGFAAPASRLWDTLTELPLADLRFTVAARTAPLSAARQTVLGAGAWAQETTVTWRLTGESTPASHRVWVTFVQDTAAVRIAGTTDGDGSDPQPLWWTGPVTAATVRGSTALVSGDADSAARARTWASRAAVAAREVASRIDPDRRWTARLVIEVPKDQADFERVLGVTTGSYAGIAAVTWPEGPDPKTAALRIIVNPGLVAQTGGGGLADEGVAILLTHEATHVATRSAASPAPTWLVEGYADAIAYEAHPATVDTAAAVALDDVTLHGPPAALPSDADFAPGAARLDLTYARAWLACRYVAETSSPTGLNRLYDAVDTGTSLDDALQSVLGVDETAFVRGWRTWLATAAQDR